MLQKRTSSRSSSQRLRNIVNENRQPTPSKHNAAAILGITGEMDAGANNFINKKAPKPKYGLKPANNNLSFLPDTLSPIKPNHNTEMFPDINGSEQTIQNLKN